ncbi:ML5 [Symbiodinium sp. KB8]|nr:ML5 [Symbiodinium sp. KB8]
MAEDPDHSASHWLQRLPEEQPEAFKVPVTHVQSSQLVQLVLDPEVAKTITMAKACRVFSTYGAVASINLSDCSRHGLVEVSYFETSSAEALVADAGKGLAAEAESQDESLTGATQAISSGYSVSQTGVPTLYPEDASGLSGSSDTGRSQVQAYGASFTELQVAALVDKLTESQNRQVQGVDIPAAHAVPLPFPESKDTSALLSINVEKLESGEDTRTTVMVARIPKTCTSERFLTRLRDLDLLNKLRFFYMPIDVSRNRPCGYVFMDFQEPADVVRLCRNLLQLGNFIGARIDRKMQVNFARIQGWEGLLQHFSGSEITFEPDANRRPQFFFPPQSVNVATFKATGDIAALQQLQ